MCHHCICCKQNSHKLHQSLKPTPFNQQSSAASPPQAQTTTHGIGPTNVLCDIGKQGWWLETLRKESVTSTKMRATGLQPLRRKTAPTPGHLQPMTTQSAAGYQAPCTQGIDSTESMFSHGKPRNALTNGIAEGYGVGGYHLNATITCTSGGCSCCTCRHHVHRDRHRGLALHSTKQLAKTPNKRADDEVFAKVWL